MRNECTMNRAEMVNMIEHKIQETNNDAEESGSASECESDVQSDEDLWQSDDQNSEASADDEGLPLNFDDAKDEASAGQEFFPFPNEKFFLLYCYAHSIMRPKVST